MMKSNSPKTKTVILQWQNPMLRHRGDEVTVFDDQLAQFAHEMRLRLTIAGGVGLAANQIGDPRQIFVWQWGESSGVAINPSLSVSTKRQMPEIEGCLSIKGHEVMVWRAHVAVLRAFDLRGDLFELLAEGYLARIFQHELDHLAGKLITDYLPDEN